MVGVVLGVDSTLLREDILIEDSGMYEESGGHRQTVLSA